MLKVWLFISIFHSILWGMSFSFNFQTKWLRPVPSLFLWLISWVCSYHLSLNLLGVNPVYVSVSLLSNSSPKSKVQTSVLGLGVDFVFPLSQQEQQQQQQQPPPKSIRRGCTKSLKYNGRTMVKLQSSLTVQSKSVGLGVDFVFPLSQQEQQLTPTKIYRKEV